MADLTRPRLSSSEKSRTYHLHENGAFFHSAQGTAQSRVKSTLKVSRSTAPNSSCDTQSSGVQAACSLSDVIRTDSVEIFNCMPLNLLLALCSPLDRKMQYQVDKMLKIVSLGAENWDEALHFGPKPDQLIANEAQSSHCATNGEEDPIKKTDSVYRAPRLAAVHYEEEEKEQVKQAKREERNRRRLEKSQILSELREEFSERPMEVQIGGQNPLDKEIAKEEADQKEFEESRFVRLVTSRKDKIRKRRREQDATRGDAMASIDNFAGVQDILSLKPKPPRGVTTPKARIGGKVGGIFAHVQDQAS